MKDGKITLEDVANLARVSRTSVSSVLNNAAPVRMSAATRQKILDAAQKLNYRRNIAASILAGGNSGLVGILIDAHAEYRSFAILREVESAAKKRGLRILTSFTHDDLNEMQRSLQTMHYYGVEGVICLSHQYPGMADTFQSLFAEETNIAFFENPNLENASYVEFSRLEAFKSLLSDLKARNVRRFFASMANPFWNSEKKLMQEFSAALKWNGIQFDTRKTFFIYDENQTTAECTRILAEKFCRMKEPPEFIFIDDAVHAVSFHSQLTARGWHLPDDLMIYGGNGDPLFACLASPIQSFDSHYAEIAEALLDIAIHPGKKTVKVVIESEYKPGCAE